MERKIIINADGKRELAKIFGVSVANVGLALLYKRNSEQSEKIRQMALAKGGRLVEIVEVTIKAPKQVKILDKYGRVKASRTA